MPTRFGTPSASHLSYQQNLEVHKVSAAHTGAIHQRSRAACGVCLSATMPHCCPCRRTSAHSTSPGKPASATSTASSAAGIALKAQLAAEPIARSAPQSEPAKASACSGRDGGETCAPRTSRQPSAYAACFDESKAAAEAHEEETQLGSLPPEGSVKSDSNVSD